MATKRAPAKKSTKKSAAKKSTKKSAKKSSKKPSKKSVKKSSKKLARTDALTTSPVTGGEDTGGLEVGFLPPSIRCIEACADAYARCLASGANPQRCMKTFLSCIQGCIRRSGVGTVGGGGILIGE